MFFCKVVNMQWCYLLTGLIASIVATGSDTIHYTNSPNYLPPGANYTAYKLDVPGTDGITIIETVNGLSSSVESDTSMDDNEPSGTKKMVFAPDLLNKFIQEYNEKQQVAKSENQEDEENDSAEDRKVTRVKFQHKRKPALNDNPFKNKDGWVTLEAVPWLKRKGSKWVPNADKASATMSSVNIYNVSPVDSLDNTEVYYAGSGQYDSRPGKFSLKRPLVQIDVHKNDGFYDRNDYQSTSRPLRRKVKPLKKKDPGYYNTPEPELQLASDYDRWYDYGFRPDGDRPMAGAYHSNETPKPPRKGLFSHNKPYVDRDENTSVQNSYMMAPPSSPNHYQDSAHHSGGYNSNTYDYNHESHDHSGHDYVYQDRPEPYRPSSHPSRNKGEWVLVSSTKGYQYPSRRHRGVTFNTQLNPTNYTMRNHKAIKLTVYPAETTDSEDHPTTTSHGGVVEVSSSQQTARNSSMQASRKRVKRKKTAVQGIRIDDDSKLDSTAVLAAVGAGMVPATVAMIMPMLGRKKRSVTTERMNGLGHY